MRSVSESFQSRIGVAVIQTCVALLHRHRLDLCTTANALDVEDKTFTSMCFSHYLVPKPEPPNYDFPRRASPVLKILKKVFRSIFKI